MALFAQSWATYLKTGCSEKVKRKGYLNIDRDTLFFFEQQAIDLFQPPAFQKWFN